MTNARLQACAANSATLILVEEALLTRSAITAATAPNHATPVHLADGDPRLARLDTLLKGLPLLPAKLTQFEPRTFLKLSCADGTTLAVEASATEEDGTVHLKIGSDMAATRAPLRKDLEILLGAPA